MFAGPDLAVVALWLKMPRFCFRRTPALSTRMPQLRNLDTLPRPLPGFSFFAAR
jgi:hypothetical protein